MKKGCSFALLAVVAVAVVILFAGPRLMTAFMKLFYAKPYAEFVQREAAESQLEENLIYAVMKAESGFDPNACSRADAKGLMQLTESTFDWISSLHPPENGGGDLYDPGDNIHCGSALLRLLLDHFGSLDVALCAYNAGIGNVTGWLEDKNYSDDGKTLSHIPFPETAAYLDKVKENYAMYNKLYQTA